MLAFSCHTDGMNLPQLPAIVSWPQSVTALWPVLISHPAESRKLSWLMTDSGYEEWLLLVLVSTEWSVVGVVICLERGADLHMAQLMPLPLTVSCFSKIHIGFIFLITAHPGRPGKRAVKRV